MMRTALTLVLIVGAAVGAVCRAAPINRCELSDGRVIYSDEPCPAGTQRTRTVNEKPPVEVIKGPVNERAQSARSTGTVQRSASEPGAESPEAASDLRKLKVAECDDLVRRVEYAQHDLNAAAAGERASAELSLRRLQAEHESKCGPRAAAGR